MRVVATVGYAEYLNSPEWGERRRRALDAAGGRCQRCPETENLEVHHITYDRLGFERPQDLQVLCNPCHALEHGRGGKNDRVVSFKEADRKGNSLGIFIEDQELALMGALDDAEVRGLASAEEVGRLRGRIADGLRPDPVDEALEARR